MPAVETFTHRQRVRTLYQHSEMATVIGKERPKRFAVPSHWSLLQRLDYYSALPDERGCVLWTGNINRGGYGVLRWGNRKRTTHRLTWEEANGPIPPSLCVCHKCDVRSCRALEHLFLGTKADNNADRDAKGRQGTLRGEASNFSKLTDALALQIFVAQGTCREIGVRYGVGRSTVSRIKRREIWRHIHKMTGRPKAEYAVAASAQ